MSALNKSQAKKLNKSMSAIDDQRLMIEQLIETMQEKFDNASERWQESDKGIAFGDTIATLESVQQSLESACEEIGNLIDLDE